MNKIKKKEAENFGNVFGIISMKYIIAAVSNILITLN